MKSKLNDHEGTGPVTTFCWKNLQCELCKTKLPCYISCNKEQISLIPLEKVPKTSYAVIETFSKEEGSLALHFVDLSMKKKLIIVTILLLNILIIFPREVEQEVI